LDFIRLIGKDFKPKVIQDTKIDRNITSCIIRDCISPTVRKEIIDQLKQSPFSLSVDESTDIHGSTYLAVATTYLPHATDNGRTIFKEPVTSLVNVIELDDSHSGKALYTQLKDNFFSLSPELKVNCVGIAYDQGSSMSGKQKGLAA
jgi:hypothetical protein